MKFNLKRKAGRASMPAVFILAAFTSSCQKNTETATETQQAQTTPAQTVAQTLKKRPAPTFYIIPEELDKKRVWICEDPATDLFHVKHDCPVLIAGKGKFRNLSIHRAIETHGRYNCQTCSQELDHIFNEEMVR